ncbi:glycine cleavage system H protein [Bombiscardovia nodaiensis]|uniref:Glycine cleavage system H protein n=1 Tax=Bombiscardovia nodaiensis TaxID=2932181 RepID=A0ABM8B9K6_9BIFI|nr:glycine cleavage system H protein [Bombiscardovia nodaiensis]
MTSESQNNAERLSIPDQLNYSQDHVWVDKSDSPAVLGVTEYATEQLGDLVFLDLPETGTHVDAGDEIVELESSKAVEPLVCPVSGTITYVNRAASDDPSVINADPYGEGWILKMDLDDDQPDLLSADDYAKVIEAAQ